ncbi:hypothetical protein N9055_00310 [Akkermansiaceae bacterium]|nr:hypothetical protein [Akkermansiaceae bacterium]
MTTSARKYRLFAIPMASVFVAILISTSIHAELRKWTNSDGLTFEGEMIDSTDSEVTIKRSSDDRQFNVPLEKLSAEDVEYVEAVRLKAKQDKPKELSELELEAINIQREELLASAETEIGDDKGRMLGEAAVLFLKIDEKKAKVEISKFIREYGKLSYSDIGADTLLGAAKHFVQKYEGGDEKAWAVAEKYYKEVWEEYRGAWSNKACIAANLVAEHYSTIGDDAKCIKHKQIVIVRGGAGWGHAGEACLWLANYYTKHENKAKALSYLNQAATKCAKGGSAKIAEKAKAMIVELKQDEE